MAAAVLPRSTAMVNAPTAKRNKKEARTDIWTSLLKQTHEAQARRSRTSAMQHRSLLVCGGTSADDQRRFVNSLARPPPPAQARNQERGKAEQRPKGEVRLSNAYAYGYGHVTLFSPPGAQGGGMTVLGAEAEEAARILVHTVPAPEKEFVGLLRRLLTVTAESDGQDTTEADFDAEGKVNEDMEESIAKPAVCILLSWKEPWEFMKRLRDWLQMLAQALLPQGTPATDPMDVLKDASLALTVAVQHTEAQEELFREGYKEEDFDYISQCLRTALLPLHPHSALVYMSSNTPPQQPGSPLSEPQKVVFQSLGLNLVTLSPKPPRSASGESSATLRKEDCNPKHEFMDRMAITIPPGWDSAAFIRTLSETFSPEEVLNAWLSDLQPPPTAPEPTPSSEDDARKDASRSAAVSEEVYASTSPIESPTTPPLSPSKLPPSTINTYSRKIVNPQAHKVAPAGPPPIDTITKPTQSFLAEMRAHLQELEAQDRDRNNNADSGMNTTRIGRGAVGMPAGEQSGALDELGDVSFNVGGVSYDAGRAIERLKRPPLNLSSSSSNVNDPGSMVAPLLSPGSRAGTPKPRGSGTPKTAGFPAGEASGTPTNAAAASGVKDLPVDKLEEYFASLIKKGSGAGSREGTPARRGGAGTE